MWVGVSIVHSWCLEVNPFIDAVFFLRQVWFVACIPKVLGIYLFVYLSIIWWLLLTTSVTDYF